jgi:hypothetical protein
MESTSYSLSRSTSTFSLAHVVMTERRKFSDFEGIKEEDVHEPTVAELEVIIDTLASQILASSALDQIPEELRKDSKKLRAIAVQSDNQTFASSLKSKSAAKKLLRRTLCSELYQKAKKSKKTAMYFKEHGLLNEIQGVYAFTQIRDRLERRGHLSGKDLERAYQVLFKEGVNLYNLPALENLEHYMQQYDYTG